MAEVTATVIMATEFMSVAGGVAAMTGDAMCMVIVLAEPPVVERHIVAADTRASEVGGGVEPRK
jgi:hypothetical protein